MGAGGGVCFSAYSRPPLQAGQPRSSCVSQSLTILHVVALEGGEPLAAGAEHQPALLVSDRGVQYASHDYVALLEAHQVRISMSRRGNPWYNATCGNWNCVLSHQWGSGGPPKT